MPSHSEPAVPTPWVCPVCRRALEPVGEHLRCARCEADYPDSGGIPLLVANAEEHQEAMDRCIRENPEWYRNDQIAWYDQGPCRHHLRRRQSIITRAMREHFEAAGLREPRILDLGCGAGANTRWLADLAGDLHGCDYNLLRLRQCAEQMGDRASICMADIRGLPYPDAFFDAILFNQVLEHIPDDERALASARRILKPGGLLVLGVPNEGAAFWKLAYRLQPETRRTTDHVHFYVADEIETKARAAGFDIRRTIRTGFGPPHWKLDERLRQVGWVDDLFEAIGRRVCSDQATSLYLLLTRSADASGNPDVEVCLYESVMREEWDALIERSPQGWAFHRREFLDHAVKALNNCECSLVAVKKRRIVGVLPLSYFAGAGSSVLQSVAIAATGPALDPDLGSREARRIEDALMERAVRLAAEKNCAALCASVPPLASAQLHSPHGTFPLEPLGFTNTSTSTYIVDLTPDEDTLYKGLNRLAHRRIRKARENGVSIRPADHDDDLDRYYALHTATYRRTGATPHPRAYFESVFHTMPRAGLAQVWAAEVDGRTIGYLSVVLYKEGAFSWTACSDDEALDLGANYLLRWHSMLAAKEAGIAYYEVGEAFPGHEGDKLAGLSQFKSAFGGERWPYHKGRIDIPRPRPSRLRLAMYYLKQSVKTLVGKA